MYIWIYTGRSGYIFLFQRKCEKENGGRKKNCMYTILYFVENVKGTCVFFKKKKYKDDAVDISNI